jgi:hypothetical protein
MVIGFMLIGMGILIGWVARRVFVEGRGERVEDET